MRPQCRYYDDEFSTRTVEKWQGGDDDDSDEDETPRPPRRPIPRLPSPRRRGYSMEKEEDEQGVDDHEFAKRTVKRGNDENEEDENPRVPPRRPIPRRSSPSNPPGGSMEKVEDEDDEKVDDKGGANISGIVSELEDKLTKLELSKDHGSKVEVNLHLHLEGNHIENFVCNKTQKIRPKR